MSGDKKNGVDWQAELKARLEAYEKRTGRQITGKTPPEETGSTEPDPEEPPDEIVEETEITAAEDDTGEAPEEEADAGEVPRETGEFPEEPEEDDDGFDYDSEPDFLAVLDGIDEDEDADSFLFRERLSRDREVEDGPDSDFIEGPDEDSLEDEDSYFDETREETAVKEPGGEPVVKVVNIEEFRMDQGVDEGFGKSREQAPLGIDDEEPPLVDDSLDDEFPKEIIVSRLLSGTVDLVIAVITAAGFMEIVAWKLSRNFFDIGILKWIGILAIFFYILNCLYFLTLIQRTPGMQLAELKLVPGRGKSGISFLPVLIRTLSFFPSALSVTGLVWAFFDHQTRCLHDIISGTRVISTRSGRITLGL